VLDVEALVRACPRVTRHLVQAEARLTVVLQRDHVILAGLDRPIDEQPETQTPRAPA
jgi:hypothetical protein